MATKKKKKLNLKLLIENNEPLTAVWQNGGFSAKLNIRISNKH
jgi:hypothetical protein